VTEAAFQATLIKRYEAEGWYVTKLIQCNKTGMPDLILTKPNEVRWVEVKAEKGRLSPVQEYRHAELRARGFTVDVIRPS
jgi:Holliday junction resolvase